MAWHASVNSLLALLKNFRSIIVSCPTLTFHPEIARVGLNEKDAISLGIKYDVTTYDISDLDRAIVDGEALG